MDVSCPACAARYTADDEKLRGKTARMRCKACNTVWLVSGPGAGSAVGQLASAPSSSASPPAFDGVPPVSIAPRSMMPMMKEESKRAAIVRTGAEREKRDLFAEQDDAVGSVKQTLLPPPSYGFNGGGTARGVGARNENSVLFRVDQLASARVKTPEPMRVPFPAQSSNNVMPNTSSLGKDDEGVIDLKALSSAPPALRPVGLPVAPLFSEPPPVTLEVDDSQRRAAHKPISKMHLIGGVAAAAVFLLVAGFGISVAFKGEKPAPLALAATAAPPPPAVTPAPTAEPASAPPPATSSDDKDADSKKGGKKTKKAAGKGRAAQSGPITNKSSVPDKKPVKAADPCGCHGDFNCILACTAKGGK